MQTAIDTVKKSWKAKIALVFFVILSVWWIYMQFFLPAKGFNHNYFSDIYGIVALWGGVWGLFIAHRWGGLKSHMGKAIIFFSIGLLLQEFGQLAYSYYFYIRNIEVPYPSWGDLGYFGSIPFYIIGTYSLAHATGLKLSLQTKGNKVIAIILPALLLGTSYFIFLKEYEFNWSQPLNVFLDFGYPLGQSIYISIALLSYVLSQSKLGGIMRSRILLILLALCFQYAADFMFLYQASVKSWVAGGINDYLYLIGYFFMTLGLLQMQVDLMNFNRKKI